MAFDSMNRIYIKRAAQMLGGFLLCILLVTCGFSFSVFAQDSAPHTATAEDIKQLFEQAQNAHEQHDYAKALQLYNQILRDEPELVEVEYQRSAVLISLKRLAEAESSLRRVIKLRADWALPYVQLGTLLSRANDPEATPILEQALKLEPGNNQAKLALAEARRKSLSKPEALTLLRQATADSAATEETWRQRALAETEAGNNPEAIAAFNRLIAFNPKNYRYRLARAELLINSESELKQALEDLQQAETLFLAAKDDRQEAVHNATNINSNAANVQGNIAALYARLGESARRNNPQNALEFYRRAATLAPQETSYATGFAASLVQARRFAEATAILRRIIAANPSDYNAHANLALALDEQKLYREALTEYLWLKEKRPELAVTNYFIARMHDQLAEYAEALLAYEAFLAHADNQQNADEIARVHLRLESLREQAKKASKRKK